MKFGQYVRVLRKREGLSARQLADTLYISERYLFDIEVGRKRPPAGDLAGDLLESIFKALKCGEEEKIALTLMASKERGEMAYKYLEMILEEEPSISDIRRKLKEIQK